MLGQPVSMLIPQVVGVRLTGELREGSTATDLVLTITEMLRKHGVVGKFVEFYGPGLPALSLADRSSRSRFVTPLWLLAVLPQLLVLTGMVDTPHGVYQSSALVAISLPLAALALMVAPADPRPAVAGVVLFVPVLTWLVADSVLGFYMFVPPLPFGQLVLCALPAVGLAVGGLVGARRLAQTLTP